jgi:hypothetical protein
MEVIFYSETSVDTEQTTQRYIPKDAALQSERNIIPWALEVFLNSGGTNRGGGGDKQLLCRLAGTGGLRPLSSDKYGLTKHVTMSEANILFHSSSVSTTVRLQVG